MHERQVLLSVLRTVEDGVDGNLLQGLGDGWQEGEDGGDVFACGEGGVEGGGVEGEGAEGGGEGAGVEGVVGDAGEVGDVG